MILLEPDPVSGVVLRGVEGDLLATQCDDLAGGALLQRPLAWVSHWGHLRMILILKHVVSIILYK